MSSFATLASRVLLSSARLPRLHDLFGSLGYAPYAAGLYTNNRYGTEWFVLLGAALCGISAGVFWMSEAAIAIAYPEPWNRGKALGYWLTYRLLGQIIGGAINLGLNVNRNEAGSVSYTVFLVFIAMQACGPIVALFLSPPDKVQRKDGKKVQLNIAENPWYEIKATVRNFLRPKFLLLLLWIGQAVFAEAVYFTYIARKPTPIFHGHRCTSQRDKLNLRRKADVHDDSLVHGAISGARVLRIRHSGCHIRQSARCKSSRSQFSACLGPDSS